MNFCSFSESIRGDRGPRHRGIAVLILSGVLTAGTILYSGCGALALPIAPVIVAGDKALELRARASRRKLPVVPESEWNGMRLWERVGDSPATYIPKGYGRNAPRGAGDGTWFVDRRDGKRLFVPKKTGGEVSAGVLRGEAIKITNWDSGHSMPGVQELPMTGATQP